MRLGTFLWQLQGQEALARNLRLRANSEVGRPREGSSDLNYIVYCKVSAGRGRASIVRSDEIQELATQAGVPLFPGSLNVLTTHPVYLLPETADYKRGGHMYFLAQVNGVDVFLNRWKGSPAHVFEIFSNQHLRSSLKVENGSALKLEIPINCVDQGRTSNKADRLAWFVLWRFRERLYYLSDWYARYVRSGWRVRLGARANQ